MNAEKKQQQLLIERIGKLSQPLRPLPASVSALLPEVGKLRAVLFDVYGTLFISGSGDISLADPDGNGGALAEALKVSGFSGKLNEAGRRGAILFIEEIERRHAAMKADGAIFPEVEIRSVWKSVLVQLEREALIENASADASIERLAVEYECRVNPVWPMPGALDMIRVLHSKGISLGIVSNAQFFTPMLFEAFWEKPLEVLGFDPTLCFWSWETLEAKPGDTLFRRAADVLASRGIVSGETLYIGNDMRNDILPAAAVGFKTALFAGDKRSLRLREDDAACVDIKPDAIITEWGQMAELAGIFRQ